MMTLVFYLYSVLALVFTGNALRRPNPRSKLPTWWLAGMVVGEYAFLLLPARLVLGGSFYLLGAWQGSLGRIAAAAWIMSVAGLLFLVVQNRQTVRRLNRDVAPERRVPGTWRDLIRHRLPADLELVRDVPYWNGCTLDLYRAKHHERRPSPTLVYVHGGGWTGGSPHRQARTLFHHLAQRGWLVLTIRYPLSPSATFPDHVVAVKRSIAWAKTGGLDWGVDPGRIVVAGGSAGGHLAALAALTATNAALQPGFEGDDTSVAACVPMYGIYDFLNRNTTRHDWPVIPRLVMKARPDDAPGAYRLASPLDQVHRGAPPFIVIHGALDSLVPPHEARQFVDRLREVSRSLVDYVEVSGGQHAFDAVHSPRTRAVVSVITEILETKVVAEPAS